VSDTALIIVVGMLLTAVTFAFLWKQGVGPGIIEKQQDSLDKQHVRIEHLQQEIDELRTAMLLDRDLLAAIRGEMKEWRRGMQINFDQMKEAGLTPRWIPRNMDEILDVPRPNSTLAQKLAERFNVEELDSLAYDIGILADDFTGETRQSRARELVQVAHRLGMTAKLRERAAQLRKDF
jgi:hypothetical protein